MYRQIHGNTTQVHPRCRNFGPNMVKKNYKHLICFINEDNIFPKTEKWSYIEFFNELLIKLPENSSQLRQIDFNIK
jgi:hypothetical protein